MTLSRKSREEPDLLGIVTFGLIIILVAVLLVTIPALFPATFNFFLDLAWTEVAPLFWWWTPTTPAAHTLVYNGIYIFFLGTIVINIIVLLLRVIFRDLTKRQIEAIGGIVMSAGVTWAAYNFSISYTLTNAFAVFCGWFVAFIGVSILITSFGEWFVRYLTK